MGGTLGLTLGGLAAAWVVMTQGDPQLAFTVGVAMFGAAVIAASSGACLPMLFQRLGLDPALLWPAASLTRLAGRPGDLETELASPEVRAWQRREFEKELRVFLRGQT